MMDYIPMVDPLPIVGHLPVVGPLHPWWTPYSWWNLATRPIFLIMYNLSLYLSYDPSN